jgi:hypothetical protein
VHNQVCRRAHRKFSALVRHAESASVYDDRMSSPTKPDPKPAPTPPAPTPPAQPQPAKKPKLGMDIDEVDVSESLERKISA